VPLAEHDPRIATGFKILDGFNSRAPRGARHPGRCGLARRAGFNSRAPRGARLTGGLSKLGAVTVSIHVPLAEHDGNIRVAFCNLKGFNSRAPRGARRQ